MTTVKSSFMSKNNFKETNSLNILLKVYFFIVYKNEDNRSIYRGRVKA